ncbi:LPD38 domain-containing protein [Paenibacillus gorillae]|uniref:LPD38 domain-containing protein n=1 Tax=Paenibacillus gorillae TaxID=1243662 RepID=UPI0004B2048D|nr:LPD38 domain-containing protein [Paenibacillus gorillae]
MSRRDRLKQGLEARERVMARLSEGPAAQSAPSRRIDRLKSEEQRAQETRSLAPELFDPMKQLQAAKDTIQPPSSRTYTGPIPDAPSFQQQVESAKRFEGTADRQREERQQRVKDAPLTRLARLSQDVAAALMPEGLAERFPAPREGSIADKAVKGTPIIEQIGQGIKATDIPGVTDSNPVTNFIRGAGDTASLGLSTYGDRVMGLPERAEGATETGAGRAGQFAGGVALPAGKFVKGASLLSNVGRGVQAGVGLGGGIEIGEQLTNRNDQTPLERGVDIGLSGLLGGGGVAALSGLGKVGTALANRMRKAGIPESEVQNLLALPAPRERGNPNGAQTPDIITPEYTFALPEPQPQAATAARVSQQSNPYRTQFESLMEQAKRLQDEGRLTPGREDLEVESLWRQMAGPNGVSLDELIQRAYPQRVNRITPDLMDRARANQTAREVAGAPFPVRSNAERNIQGQIAPAAAPQTIPGRAPGVAPTKRIDITEEAQALNESPETTPNKYTGFKTSKGSTYTLGENGSTQRTKTLHEGHNPNDVGLKTPSQLTVYVDKDVAKLIGSHGSLNKEADPRVVLGPDGMYLVSKNSSTGRWGWHGDKIPYTSEPEVGKSPIEFWNITQDAEVGAYSKKYHAGNDIVEINGKSDLQPMQLPTEPSSSKLGFSAFGSKVKPYDNLSTDTKSQLVTRADREKLPLNVMSDKAYTKLVDNLHPLNIFDKEVERVVGSPLKAADRSHTLALNTRGADVIAHQILTTGQLDNKGHVIGKSLKEILSGLPNKRHSYVDFEDYLLNKHAITRAGRGEKVFRDSLNWTPDAGASKVAAYEARYPQFKEMSEEIYQFQQNMVDRWLVDSGLLNSEQAQAFMAANPTYVPNKRFFSELERAGTNISGRSPSSFGGQKAPVKGYQKGGSQRKIISPIESMIENVDAFVKAAKRNEVMQTVVQNLRRDPEALEGFIELVPEHQAMSAQSLKQINEALKSDGIDGLVANLTNDFDASFRQATQTGLDKDNVVRVMMDGEPVYIKVNDKPMLEAIMAMGPNQSNWFIQMVGKATQVFKTLTTGANPVFGLTRNLWRDIPSAYTASKTTNNPILFMSDLLHSAYEIATDGKLYREFKNFGGGHSSPIASDRNMLAQSKRQIIPSRNKLQGIIPKAYDGLQNLMNAVENAPRLAEYKRASAGGAPEDKIRGLFEAQDLTVNFKRRGSAVRELDAFFPYFNAAVQGLDKFARTYKDNKGLAIAKSALAVGVPAMVAYAMNYNNPDYEKVSRRTKDNFYLFPNPAKEGSFIKIAKPKEIGTVFADIPERLMDRFMKQDPEAFRDFADQIRTTFLVPGIQGAAKSGGITDRLAGVVGDTIAGPIADVAANRNFADSPIVPAYLERLSPELQSDARTSSLAKAIGEHTGTSPKSLDYLMKQYSGVIGQLGLPMMTPGAGDNPLQAAGSALAAQMTVDPVFSNDIMTKFYDRKSKLDQARTDYGVTGELPKDYNNKERKYLGKVSDKISDIRKEMRVIETDQTMPAKEKRETLRQMQDQMNQLAQAAISN